MSASAVCLDAVALGEPPVPGHQFGDADPRPVVGRENRLSPAGQPFRDEAIVLDPADNLNRYYGTI